MVLQPSAPKVYTYHCICTSLLLATTHTLSSLPIRQPPALDKAIILPLPPAPFSPSPEDEGDDDGNNNDQEDTSMTEEGNTAPNKSPLKPLPPAGLSDLGYTILLSMTTDTRPTIVRREDGFEKRYLHRCGRCRLVLGYELDESHFPVDGSKVKILYVLPGGMMSMEVMAQGRKIGEAEVELGEKGIVGVWE